MGLLRVETGDPCHVSAGPLHAFCEANGNGIKYDREYGRDLLGRFPSGLRGGGTEGCNHIDFRFDQFGHKRRNSIWVSFGKTAFDDHILSIDVALSKPGLGPKFRSKPTRGTLRSCCAPAKAPDKLDVRKAPSAAVAPMTGNTLREKIITAFPRLARPLCLPQGGTTRLSQVAGIGWD